MINPVKWNGKINELATIFIALKDSGIISGSNEDIKRFFNPNSERTKRLFLDYFEVDITQAWRWANYDIIDAKKALDSLISKRGDAAHRANTAAKKNCDVHLVKRDELEKAIRFLKGLVDATDQYKITK